jgi:hypothetical protein
MMIFVYIYNLFLTTSIIFLIRFWVKTIIYDAPCYISSPPPLVSPSAGPTVLTTYLSMQIASCDIT